MVNFSTKSSPLSAQLKDAWKLGEVVPRQDKNCARVDKLG